MNRCCHWPCTLPLDHQYRCKKFIFGTNITGVTNYQVFLPENYLMNFNSAYYISRQGIKTGKLIMRTFTYRSTSYLLNALLTHVAMPQFFILQNYRGVSQLSVHRSFSFKSQPGRNSSTLFWKQKKEGKQRGHNISALPVKCRPT